MAVVWPSKNNFANGDVLTASNMNNIADTLNVFNPTSATNGQVWVANGSGSGAYGSVSSGLTLIKPTSINFTGTSASINTNGSVVFNTVTILSLNGVFSATYDNYLVVLSGAFNTGFSNILVRMRAAGTDAGGANTYLSQRLLSNAGTTTSLAGSATEAFLGIAGTDSNASVLFSNPFAADQTVMSSVCASSASTAYWSAVTVIHNVTTSYDGFSFRQDLAQSMTGQVAVYGLQD